MKKKGKTILLCVLFLLALAYAGASLCGTEPLLSSAAVRRKHEAAVRPADIYFGSGEIAIGLLREIPVTDTYSAESKSFRVSDPLGMASLCGQLRIGSSSRRSLLLARPELMLHYDPVYFINRGILCLSVKFSYLYPRPRIASMVREGSRLTVTLEEIDAVIGCEAEWDVFILIGLDKGELAGVKEVDVIRKRAPGTGGHSFNWEPFWGVKSQEWLEGEYAG